jgi:hypothetical protein
MLAPAVAVVIVTVTGSQLACDNSRAIHAFVTLVRFRVSRAIVSFPHAARLGQNAEVLRLILPNPLFFPLLFFPLCPDAYPRFFVSGNQNTALTGSIVHLDNAFGTRRLLLVRYYPGPLFWQIGKSDATITPGTRGEIMRNSLLCNSGRFNARKARPW